MEIQTSNCITAKSDTPNTLKWTHNFSDGPGSINKTSFKSDIWYDSMVNWLYQQQCEHLWTDGSDGEGVILKTSDGKFLCFPPDLRSVSNGVYQAIRIFNVKV